MSFIHQLFKDVKTPLYRNAIYLMMNTAVSSVLGLLFWIVVVRYYTAHEVGLAVAVIAVLGLISTLSRIGLDAGLVRFLPSSGKDVGAVINTCFTIVGLVAILVSVVFLIGLDVWSPALLFLRENWLVLLSFILFSVVFTLLFMLNQVYIAGRDARFVLATTSLGGMRILLPIALASSFGAYGIFTSWSLPILIAFLVGLFIFVPRVFPHFRPVPTLQRNVVNRLFHFSMGNYVAGIFKVMPRALLPLLIVNTLPAENAAYYYVAFTIAGFLFAIVAAVCQSLFAEGSHFEEDLKSSARKALKLTMALLVPCAILIIIFGGHLLLLFGTDYSAEGLVLLQILAIASIFIAFNGIFLETRRVMKKMTPVIVVSVFEACAIIGMAYVFIQYVGLVGIAVAWTLSAGIVSVGIGLHMIRQRKRRAAVVM